MTEDTEYVANSAWSWGKGDSELEAFQRLAGYWHNDVPDTVEISIVEVSGFNGIEQNGLYRSVDADEHYTEARYEIDGEVFEEIQHHLGRAEVKADGALADGWDEDIDHQEDE